MRCTADRLDDLATLTAHVVPVFYAVALRPLKRCKRRQMTPRTSTRWNRPMDMWNAKMPSNQHTIKAAAIIPNMISSPYAYSKVGHNFLRTLCCAPQKGMSVHLRTLRVRPLRATKKANETRMCANVSRILPRSGGQLLRRLPRGEGWWPVSLVDTNGLQWTGSVYTCTLRSRSTAVLFTIEQIQPENFFILFHSKWESITLGPEMEI
jgi:hypothetical protein